MSELSIARLKAVMDGLPDWDDSPPQPLVWPNQKILNIAKEMWPHHEHIVAPKIPVHHE